VTHEQPSYPDAITQFGVRDRPLRVDPISRGLWRVEWRSGVVTLYRSDPRAELMIGYEPGRNRVRPDIANQVVNARSREQGIEPAQ